MPSLQNNPQQSTASAAQAGGSRPGSSHSAPMLDLSIDRHYEFDAARTPTDDLGHISGDENLNKFMQVLNLNIVFTWLINT